MNKQKSKEKKLAWELAEALNDKDVIEVYYKFVEKYKPEFLREILAKVMSVPEEKIKRSRGALFTYLIQQHGKY